MNRLRQFDLCATAGTPLEDLADLVVVLQSDLVERGNSAVVAPMFPPAEIRKAGRLTPILMTPLGRMLVSVPELTSTDSRMLGPTVGNISSERYHIISAFDLLFTGV